jgi:hypothetical protein
MAPSSYAGNLQTVFAAHLIADWKAHQLVLAVQRFPIDECQWASDRLQWSALRCYAEAPLHYRSTDHQD